MIQIPKSFTIFFITILLFSPSVFSNQNPDTITCCFTPGENCTQKIVNIISHAKKLLWIQAYQFTSQPISNAVIAAKQRGVDVRIILDKTQYTQNPNAPATLLSQAGIPVWIDNKVKIAHNKVMIVDNHDLISGSFNFSRSAQTRNAENVLIIKSSTLAKLYAANWKNRQAASLTLQEYIALRNTSQTKHKHYHHHPTKTCLTKLVTFWQTKMRNF